MEFLARFLFLPIEVSENRLVGLVLSDVHHEVEGVLPGQCVYQDLHELLLLQLVRHHLERLLVVHNLDGYVLEHMLKVRGELLGLPVAELRIRVFVVPHNHGLLLLYEGAIGLFCVGLHDVLN